MNSTESGLYARVSREIVELDKDLTRGLASVGYMAKANKSEVDSLSARLRALEEAVQNLRRVEAATQVRLSSLEEAKKDLPRETGEHDSLVMVEHHKQQTEQLKARLAFWGPVILLALTNVISLVLHWAGVSSGA